MGNTRIRLALIGLAALVAATGLALMRCEVTGTMAGFVLMVALLVGAAIVVVIHRSG